MIQVRPARISDAELLFAWRNDESTRQASINVEPVAWEDHVRWLTASLANRNRRLLIAELEGVPVGTVRIDQGERTEISWTVSPGMRGKGVGKAIVSRSLPHGEVTARIKHDNVASQKIAASAGFMLVIDRDLQEWVRAG